MLLVYLLVLLLALLFAAGTALLVVIHKQRQSKLLSDYNEQELRHSNEILKTRVEVQERSMNLVSDEIHDSVGQILTVALNYLQRAVMNGDQPEMDLLVKSKDLLRKCIKELRTISHSLNSDLVREMGLIRSVAREVEALNDLGMKSEFELEGTPVQLTKEQNLLIYRIVQESIQNIIKHSGATQCSISLSFLTHYLRLLVKDNGSGFEKENILAGNHFGLMSIRSRASLLKAELNIDTASSKGCNLELLIPLI